MNQYLIGEFLMALPYRMNYSRVKMECELIYIQSNMCVPTQRLFHTRNLTPEQTGERDVVKNLKTTPCMLVLLLFSCSTPVFHFGEGRRDEVRRGRQARVRSADSIYSPVF